MTYLILEMDVFNTSAISFQQYEVSGYANISLQASPKMPLHRGQTEYIN